MTRPLLILLLLALSSCTYGCTSRSQYLRDRLQDSQDKQRQASLNAEILRSMDSFQSRWNKIQIERIEALEKKMDERKEPCVMKTLDGYEYYFDIYHTTGVAMRGEVYYPMLWRKP